MPSLEEDQGKLASSIAQALDGSLSVSAAAESVVSAGDWLQDLQPRCYAVVSVALSRSLVGVLQAQTAQPGCFFDSTGTRRIQILLSVRLSRSGCYWECLYIVQLFPAILKRSVSSN